MKQVFGLVVSGFGIYGAYKWIKEKGPTPWGKKLFEKQFTEETEEYPPDQRQEKTQ
ncbi:MAG: hypothetical protein OXC63_13725 [Aestuariivita sp.]|nr:hypothetical protein [Aestuariivita sp.]MCY4347196.1 hypothetical protein [Aestuariivita sp.]